MDNFREQVFQTTDNFLIAIRQLTQQHAALILQETFSSLGSAKGAASDPKPRGAKRGTDELDQLSARFAQFVAANPGLRIEQINKQLGTTTAELALPIRKLIASGAVSVKGAKRATAYFGATKTPEGDSKKAAPAVGKGAKKRSHSKKNRTRSRSKTKR
jgi:CRP-like cAMP-binding protein